jgi:hypothetical protein
MSSSASIIVLGEVNLSKSASNVILFLQNEVSYLQQGQQATHFQPLSPCTDPGLHGFTA